MAELVEWLVRADHYQPVYTHVLRAAWINTMQYYGIPGLILVSHGHVLHQLLQAMISITQKVLNPTV